MDEIAVPPVKPARDLGEFLFRRDVVSGSSRRQFCCPRIDFRGERVAQGDEIRFGISELLT